MGKPDTASGSSGPVAKDEHYAFDFYPLQSEDHTRIFPFFDHLREGRLTTTKCRKCGAVLWQPRVVCSHCGHNELEWVDLPTAGTIFAHTAVILGAPAGLEKDVPFVVAVIQLEDSEHKVIARVDDATYEDLQIGDPVTMKVIELEDGRVWFRFVPKR
jgi:uncharacterized OB-fold protein